MPPLRAFAAFALVALATAKRNDQTFTFRFGATRVSVVQDGLLKFPANPFLAPDALVRRSFDFFNPGVDPAFFTQNVALLRRGPHVILVDTGSGPSPTFFGTAGKLIANLATLGVEPKHVTHVLLTHGHFDHVGGLVDAAGKAAFPNAKITISRREVEYWSQPLEAIVASTPLLPPPFTGTLRNDLQLTRSAIDAAD